MLRLALTLPTAAENLALDEALLDWAETDGSTAEFLRIWESPYPMVVVGRSSRVEQEVHVEVCQERGIPVLRRSSGGAAIVAGPGCLMFAVVLSHELRPQLRDIRRAHCEILGQLAEALRPELTPLGRSIAQAGTSDLVIKLGAGNREQGDASCSPLVENDSVRKFSGNSLRAKRTHLLYHGTLLYDFDLALVEICLKQPPRQPDYREARAHRDFVTNLPLSRGALIEAIDAAWPTQADVDNWPQEIVATLVAERFGRHTWNLEFG